MKRVLLSFIAMALTLCFVSVAAAQSPAQLSLFNPLQIVPATGSVEGASLGIFYTSNRNVTGLSYTCIVNKVTGNMKGFQGGLINLVDGQAEGVQNGFVNVVGGDFTGWQAGGFNINNSTTMGLQTGLFNKTGALRGIQFSFVNLTGMLHGIQIGLVNVNRNLVTQPRTLHGIQLGLININLSGSPVGFLPVVNWSF